jgi:membrane protein DedA with SNARE-associated domain
MHAALQEFTAWYQHLLESSGYLGIVLLMAMESSIFPIPSEAVIAPAAMLAHTKGTFSLGGIVLAGTLGCWIGATVMYWAARILGRPFLMKYGPLVLISKDKIEKAERWSARFGGFGVFASRLVLVVRHLIGIPAGIVRFNFLKYSVYTVLGSALWCSVLCWAGVAASNDSALMRGDLKAISLWATGTLGILATIYYFAVHRTTRQSA